MSRRKRLFLGVATFTLFCALFVAGGEVFMRVRRSFLAARLNAALAHDGEHTGWAIFDPVLHYRNRPGWRDHNEWGMRDESVGQKEKDRFRLLLIGDSIGYYGNSIADTYPEQLEAKLNTSPNLMPCEVLNASTKGYTNYQQLLFFKEYGLQLEPDAVALAFCVNDLHRFLHQFDIIDGQLVLNSYDFTSDVKNFNVPPRLRSSLFLAWLWRRGGIALSRFSGAMPFETRPDIRSAWQDDYWPMLEQQIAEMAGLAGNRNTPLFLIAFPCALQYREDYLTRDRDYVLKPQRNLQVICERLRIPLLDLYSALDVTHFEDDGIHLTQRGRTRAAEAIREFVVRQRLVPEPRAESTDIDQPPSFRP